MVWNNLRNDQVVDAENIMENFEYLQYNFAYPKYTTAQREAIAPSMGVIVYDTTTLSLFAGNNINWVEVG